MTAKWYVETVGVPRSVGVPVVGDVIFGAGVWHAVEYFHGNIHTYNSAATAAPRCRVLNPRGQWYQAYGDSPGPPLPTCLWCVSDRWWGTGVPRMWGRSR